jgi:hypothetical protein
MQFNSISPLKYFKDDFFKFISLIFFVIINVTFLYKYSSRIISFPIIVSMFYGGILIGLFYMLSKTSYEWIQKRIFILLLSLMIVTNIILLLKINIHDLNIDRWSVITSFLDELFSGNFPYLAKSHLNNPPGPFPGYFLLALPFYLIGEIGLLSLSGVLLFLYLVKIQYNNSKILFIAFIFLFTSVTVWYELAVRSTLFINMVLPLIYLFWLKKKKSFKFQELLIMGIIGGIILSTRGIMLYVLLVIFVFVFVVNGLWREFFLITFSTIIGFFLTLAPFIIWDLELFIQFNPITLQASFIPPIYLILFTFIAVGIGYYTKSIQQLYAYIAIFIIFMVSISFSIDVVQSSLNYAIVNNGFDISYFIFSIPFLLLSISCTDYYHDVNPVLNN